MSALLQTNTLPSDAALAKNFVQHEAEFNECGALCALASEEQWWPRWRQNPQNGYTAEENRIARLAIDHALEALGSHLNCQEFFQGTLKVDPSQTLKDIHSNDGFKRGARGKRDYVAWTTLAAGNRSVIHLYDRFFERSVGGVTTEFLPSRITTNHARALIILHEFAHAIWRTFHAGPFGGMSSAELDRAIFIKCFDGGQQPLPRGVAE